MMEFVKFRDVTNIIADVWWPVICAVAQRPLKSVLQIWFGACDAETMYQLYVWLWYVLWPLFSTWHHDSDWQFHAALRANTRAKIAAWFVCCVAWELLHWCHSYSNWSIDVCCPKRGPNSDDAEMQSIFREAKDFATTTTTMTPIRMHFPSYFIHDGTVSAAVVVVVALSELIQFRPNRNFNALHNAHNFHFSTEFIFGFLCQYLCSLGTLCVCCALFFLPHWFWNAKNKLF